jgi:flagellar hook assembly protein FlgD
VDVREKTSRNRDSLSTWREGGVDIGILNALGQEIVQLSDRRYSAGNHTLHRDGRDRDGIPVPSGTNFYQLSADEFFESKRMILLR